MNYQHESHAAEFCRLCSDGYCVSFAFKLVSGSIPGGSYKMSCFHNFRSLHADGRNVDSLKCRSRTILQLSRNEGHPFNFQYFKNDYTHASLVLCIYFYSVSRLWET
jgi:hypothetical protein